MRPQPPAPAIVRSAQRYTALVAGALLGCSGRDATLVQHEGSVFAERRAAERPLTGQVALAISSSGVALRALRFQVEAPGGQIVLADALDVADPGQGLELEFAAPPGTGYRIRLFGEGDAGVRCSGAAEFDVAADATTEVPVPLSCEDSGRVRVVGSLTPAPSCPELEITVPSAPLDVGAALQLTAAPAVEGIRYVWASSGGELLEARTASAVFRCTEAGQVTLTLTASGAGCTEVASTELTCRAPASGGACSGLGSQCHVVDPGSGPLRECHELGHGGDEAACSAGRDACVDACGSALCETLGSLCHAVDPGSGPLHECHELGHAGDTAACFARGRECFELCTEARASLREPVTLRFEPQVGEAAFRCGTSYEEVGATAVRAEPRDFRLFLSEVRLVTADGREEPVEIEERSPWQLPGVALLDFEDASGLCASGTAETNALVTGRVFPGEYVGVRFQVGVPEALNHRDPATLPAPLELGTLSWGWLLGYKFLVAELAQLAAEPGAGLGLLHLGSTACTGNPAAGDVVCTKPNRSSVSLSPFDPATNAIVVDIAALFAGTDLAQQALCHSSGEFCAAPFEQVGLDFATGQPAETQTMFRVK